jgi:hypothetical protein
LNTLLSLVAAAGVAVLSLLLVAAAEVRVDY